MYIKKEVPLTFKKPIAWQRDVSTYVIPKALWSHWFDMLPSLCTKFSNMHKTILNSILFYHCLFLHQHHAALKTMCACKVAQSCPTLCDPVDCSPPGSSVHEILQAGILGCVAIPFSRGSSWPRDQTWVFCIASRFSYHLNHQGSPYCFSWHIASSFQIESDERWYSANVYFIEDRSAFTLVWILAYFPWFWT